MRHHGWELPYHPLQVVAIAVFISLAFAFYVFFIPFLGSKVLQYHIIALFSPLVVLVFALYIRCAAANPADPGVGKPIKEYTKCSSKKSAATSDSKARSANPRKNVDEQDTEIPVPCWKKLLSVVCSCFLRDTSKNSRCQEDLLYCSLCEAEIFKFSKHCRACDKCVEGFDHHCRWINNCIGKRNYRTFVALMVTSLLLLLLEWGIGVFVIVRCLLNRSDFEDDIVSKLGSSFSLVPFIVVVGLCTLLAMLATFPLGQLFFFHMILIHKGLSTYDYIVAMRERDQLQGDEQSSQSSPVSSVATAASGLSSQTMQKRPWCTPPRLLVEQQDTIVKGPSLADVEHGKAPSKKEETGKRKAVKINPWKLARLSAEDASKAIERARDNSSVLRPVGNEQPIVVTETDNSSPEERLRRSTASEIVPVARKTKRKRDISSPSTVSTKERSPSTVRPPTTKCVRERKHHEPANGHVKNPGKDTESIAPLQLEARSAFWPRPPKSLVPSMALLSPDDRPGGNGLQQSSPQPSSSSTKPWLQRSVSDGYEASGGESADDSEHGRRLAHAWSRLKQSSTYMSRSSLRTGSSSVLPPPVPAPVNHRLRISANVVYNSLPVQRFAPSTDESNSSPSRYNSPDRDSDFFSAEAVMMAAPRHRNGEAFQ